MSTPISSGFTYREDNFSFIPPSSPSTITRPSPSLNSPMVEQLVKEVVEKVVDQAVEEQLLKEALKSTLTSVVDLEVDSNWRVFLAQFGPAVPLLPSAPDFALGDWVSGIQPQAEARSKPKRYQCHMAECQELGRGLAD